MVLLYAFFSITYMYTYDTHEGPRWDIIIFVRFSPRQLLSTRREYKSEVLGSRKSFLRSVEGLSQERYIDRGYRKTLLEKV